MRRKFVLSVVTVLILSFTIGCSSKNISTSVKEKVTEDENFLKDLSRSVNERGIIVKKADEERKELGDKFDDEKEIEYYKSYIKTESDILYKYEDAEFEDRELQKLAIDYIDGVGIQEKSLEYVYGDVDKFFDLWEEGYGKRSVVLIEMVNEYGVEVDESSLEGLKQNAQSVSEKQEVENKINEMFEVADFKLESTSGEFQEYIAIIENTTGVKFQNFDLNIKLIDGDGITVDSPSDWITNWNTGEKVKVSFSTEENFSEIQWEWEYEID